jgi:zinc protease
MWAAVGIRYGSVFDPADRSGLAYLTTRLIGKATFDRTGKDIKDELEYLKATLDVRCDWDGMRFSIRCPGPAYERALLLLYQVVGEAVFNEDDVSQAKQELLKELEAPPDPRQRILRQFETVLFRGTSYGRTLRGNATSIRSVTAGDVRLFHRRFFTPNAAALVVASSVPPPQLLQKITRIWGVWVRKDEIPFTFMPPRTPAARNIYLEDDPSSPAAQFVLGNLWPRRDDPAYYAATIAQRILQERLTKALPTSLVTVSSEGRKLTGPFRMQGQAAADQAVDQIRQILDIAESIKSAGVTPAELAEAQNRWVAEYAQSVSTNEGLCSMLLDAELYRLGTNYGAALQDYIRRCDPESVKIAAKDWLIPGGVVILIRGPAGVLKTQLESLGTVQPLVPGQ